MAEESTTSAPPALAVDVPALTELLDGRYADVRRTVRELLPTYASVLEDAETLPREELKPLKRRIDAAEKTVAKLTGEIAAIDAQLADGLFARDAAKATALSKARAEAADALAKAEEDWLTASAQYEDAMA